MPGYFGGKAIELVLEEEKPKLNLFEEFKQVLDGKAPHVELLVPINAWYSNTTSNIQACQVINRYFFWVDKNILTHMLVLNMDMRQRFIKYPKSKKEAGDLDFLIPYIQQYYGWTQREWGFYRQFFNLEDPELHQTLDKRFCFEKAECKKLGIVREKLVKKFEPIQKTRGFF